MSHVIELSYRREKGEIRALAAGEKLATVDIHEYRRHEKTHKIKDHPQHEYSSTRLHAL
jgi:hypothetical protein